MTRASGEFGGRAAELHRAIDVAGEHQLGDLLHERLGVQVVAEHQRDDALDHHRDRARHPEDVHVHERSALLEEADDRVHRATPSRRARRPGRTPSGGSRTCSSRGRILSSARWQLARKRSAPTAAGDVRGRDGDGASREDTEEHRPFAPPGVSRTAHPAAETPTRRVSRTASRARCRTAAQIRTFRAEPPAPRSPRPGVRATPVRRPGNRAASASSTGQRGTPPSRCRPTLAGTDVARCPTVGWPATARREGGRR
jgi:hypothetical protein